MGMFDNIKPLKGKPGGDQIPENDALTQLEMVERDLASGEGCVEYRRWLHRCIDRIYGAVA